MKKTCFIGKAFTLAEAVVAIGLLAIIILVLIGIFTSGLATQDKGNEDIRAIAIAEAEMNYWKARPYQEVYDRIANPPPTRTRSADGGEYSSQLKVEVLTPSDSEIPNPDDRTLKLTVVVSWMSQAGLDQGKTKAQHTATLKLVSIISPGVAL